MRPYLLVTGSMRSGTTYVGTVLSQLEDYYYLHEPFNPAWGIEGINHWLTYVEQNQSQYAPITDSFASLSGRFKNGQTPNFWKRQAKHIIGNRGTWRLRYYRCIAQKNKRLLVKDPLAAFASKYLHEQHGFDVLVLVRHPMAFYQSNKRMGWNFDFTNLLQQSELIETHLSQEARWMKDKTLNYPQRIGLLWRCIYKVLRNFTDTCTRPDRWILLRHEDLSLDPIATFEKITDTFQVNLTDRARQFIQQRSSSRNPVTASGKRLHNFHRDVHRLAFNWKSQVTQAEIQGVRSMVGEEANYYYEASTWALHDS